MARKAKADLSAAQPDIAALETSDLPNRRSSRRKSNKPVYTEDDPGLAVEDTLPIDGGRPAGTVRRGLMEQGNSPANRAALKRALDGVGELDAELIRQTKRQKKLVAQSGIATDLDTVTEAGAGAGTPPSGGQRAPKVKKQPRAKKAVTRDISGGEEEDDGDDAYVASDGDPVDELDAPQDAAERGAARPPAVNSSYLPLPWKGRLGYACLNTYLRAAKPSVFCSRTCRMASIIDHRFPLQDPSQPEHQTKNRPDKSQEADVARGEKYVQELGLTNARDLPKMLRWNDRYGIRFMRLSSEMFPFASHPEHGYRLAPFASEVLAEAGRVVAELGHRVTMHPGQFTQLGSPRKEVITASVRDLEYHDELLSLLKLPEQQDRDAVMIIHMGGVFGDKAATLDRFRKNYTTLLSPSIKARLVLENDDVSWSVHELLPVCEELDIPLVLDFHHHNIVFDPAQVREGTYDISQPALMDRILATWRRKGIRPKMHYSEQCAGAVTPRDRRKHSPRVATLPPCPPDMDLMIEAKDKEQAVFELMRTFKLPGFERIADVVPHERDDEDRPPAKVQKTKAGSKKMRKKVLKGADADDAEERAVDVDIEPEGRDMGRTVSAEEFAMGGPLGRVYWPLGREDWLRPKKREGKVKVEPEGDL